MGKSIFRVGSIIGATLAFITGTLLPAQAGTVYYNTSGTVNESGTLYQFQTVRWHNLGDANWNMTSMASCGGYIDIGLRDSSGGYQVSNSLRYFGPGTRWFMQAGGTGSNLPASYYSTNARGLGAGCGNGGAMPFYAVLFL
ncbi:hypothetical protein [Paenarthrobacter sp. NPDC058040]|uniref:hypothetical protein n=1 Tax=unclassified Paenarthrobacter TaxID=2634190 RepID=UPI0036DF15B4